MSLNGFLDHLLKSAAPSTVSGNDGRGGIGGMLGSDFGKGTLAGGALGLLLGRNKTTRKLATYGGLAALGMMAYRAYGDYKAQQGAPVQPQTVDRLPPPQANLHGEAILRALVAAAKADGHLDARERQVIGQGPLGEGVLDGPDDRRGWGLGLGGFRRRCLLGGLLRSCHGSRSGSLWLKEVVRAAAIGRVVHWAILSSGPWAQSARSPCSDRQCTSG